ncbi:putative jasmonate O-methyltransferase [Helianthus anomalus]
MIRDVREWDAGDWTNCKISSGNRVSKTIRAVVEPMFENHFHLGVEMMDELFRRYAKIIDDYFLETKFNYINFSHFFREKGLIYSILVQSFLPLFIRCNFFHEGEFQRNKRNIY